MAETTATRTEPGSWAPTIDTTDLAPVYSKVLDHAESAPHTTATIFRGEELTYSQLAIKVDDVAKALIGAGITKGDCVGTLSTPRPEFLVIYLAASSIGAVWQGLNPKYTQRELAHVLHDAAPRMVFSLTDEESPGLFEKLTGALTAVNGAGRPTLIRLSAPGLSASTSERRAVGWHDFLALGEEVSDDHLDRHRAYVAPADPAIVVYTSGTTGAPKGALVRHSGLSRLAHIQSDKWAIKQPRIIMNLPINHIGGVGDLCSVTLYAGGALVFSDIFDPHDTLDLIERHKVSALFQVPAQLQMLAADPSFEDRQLESLGMIAWGGSTISPAVIEKYRAKGCRAQTTYGLTEVTSSVSYTEDDADIETLTTTVGRPDPELDLRFLGPDNQWTGPTGPGEICVKHPTVMAGYLHQTTKTSEAFTEGGWLRTGDIGELDRDGNLRLIGRAREMYKSGGYNIYPREIEQVLEEVPGVEMAVVVPQPHPKWGEVGAAYLETAGSVDLQDVRAHAKANLATYKIPKSFAITPLPRLQNQKIDKQKLRTLAQQVSEHQHG